MTRPRADTPEPIPEVAPADPASPRDGGDHLIVRIFDHTVEALAALMLAAITLLLFTNASARYLFDSPIGWASEIATGLVLWLAMLGLLIAARRRDLIVVRVFVRTLPLRVQVWMKMFADTVTAFVFTHLAWVSSQYVQVFGLDQSAYLRMPKGFFTAALPVGAAALAIVVLLQTPTARAFVQHQADEDRVARAEAADRTKAGE